MVYTTPGTVKSRAMGGLMDLRPQQRPLQLPNTRKTPSLEAVGNTFSKLSNW